MPEIPNQVSDAFGTFIPQMPDVGGLGNIIVILIFALICGLAVIIFFKKNPLKKYGVVVKVNEHLKNGERNTVWTEGRSLGKIGEFREYELKNGDKTKKVSYKDLVKMTGGKFFLELDKFEDGRYIPHRDRYVAVDTKTPDQIEEYIEVPNPDNPEKTIKQKVLVDKEKQYAQALYQADINHDDVNHLVQTIKENLLAFGSSSFWSKYGLPVFFIVGTFAMLMLIYVTVQYGAVPIIDGLKDVTGSIQGTVAIQQNITDKWLQQQQIQNEVTQQLIAELRATRTGGTVIT